MIRRVWIVERSADGKKWEPCGCSQLTRKDAIREKAFYWKYNHPEWRCRVSKYIRKTK